MAHCFFRLGKAAAAGGWLLDYSLVEEEIQGSKFIYMVDDPAVSRSRPESSAPPGTKACREKLRRDRLNERFNELYAILEPGKPPKADKVAILSDATRLQNEPAAYRGAEA
ncbi:unnamed protein product [Miscanthus lutarioriparius]|uniref:BHLH domain-containing protein n=1 Tax=Miscanthus lutarioriparius TaxID=422564 RepID=A0A811R9A2_9POAL|nr:unnamed protein product [Miscanthus lutarioriparius]